MKKVLGGLPMLNKLSRKDIDLLNILAQTTESKNALDEYIEQHEKAVRAYKVYCESVVAEVKVPNVEKTANESRAEIIEKAKEFVKENKSTVVKIESRYYAVNTIFIIDTCERTVVALVKGVENCKVRFEGIAKCHPNDVFNKHVGKAIALGRALGKDVSEFENAVQPDEAVVGMIVKPIDKDEKLELSSLGRTFIGIFGCTAAFNLKNKTTWLGDNQISKVIDDTNARYKN